jgi:hypothetical protein
VPLVAGEINLRITALHQLYVGWLHSEEIIAVRE